mmetsp:Transcript_6932/g.13632  ORF Transcript_6932/g.13632 Transcript_6932/m.13632 type:complete len:450 (+) Transcript_6932:3-1352(+)
MPEGLLIFAPQVAKILENFTGVETVLLGDVTYGACCIDDVTAKGAGCDFLVHYGHSCLVPIDEVQVASGVATMYVFVDIAMSVDHLVETVKTHFTQKDKLALMGTIQFSSTLHSAGALLKDHFQTPLVIPQQHPLTSGEVLGCTSPRLSEETEMCVFVADGRFHLEAAMIKNPHVKFFRYDPFTKKLVRESYGHSELFRMRRGAIEKARRARVVALCLGTLGRQGSVGILERVQSVLDRRGVTYMVVLVSELTPSRVKALTAGGTVEAVVQVACPRLSIDWGHLFPVPVLSPFEAFVAFGESPEGQGGGDPSWSLSEEKGYPMDFYARGSGPWTNYFEDRPRNGSLSAFGASAEEAKAQRAAAIKARLAARRERERARKKEQESQGAPPRESTAESGEGKGEPGNTESLETSGEAAAAKESDQTRKNARETEGDVPLSQASKPIAFDSM